MCKNCFVIVDPFKLIDKVFVSCAWSVQHMNEGRHDGMPTMFCVARELTLMSIMLAEFP